MRIATVSIDPSISRKPQISIAVNVVPRNIHVSRALEIGSTVTNRLAFTLPRMLIPIPYMVNGISDPNVATAMAAIHIRGCMCGMENVRVMIARMIDAASEPHPITFIRP